VRHASGLSYEEFVVHYMAPNVPVIIKVTQYELLLKCSAYRGCSLRAVASQSWREHRSMVQCTPEVPLAGW
jgi:hypothetical protein